MSERLTGDFRKYMDKSFLGSWDVPDGGDLVLTIDHVSIDEVQNDRGKQNKMTLHFKERDYKPMICNTTNAKAISKAYGSTRVEDWENKKIGIFKATISAFGQTQECLRVREYPPKVTEEICEGCGMPITEHGSYTVNKIVTMTKAKYGACLCWDCAKKMKEEQETANDNLL